MLSLRVLLPCFCVLVLYVLWHPPSILGNPETTDRARKFVDEHTARLRSLEIAGNRAWWDANISGLAADFQKKIDTQNQIDAALADKTVFAKLKDLHEHVKDIDDPILRRSIEVLYRTYLEKQVEPELLQKIVAKANQVEKNFNTFRAKVDGKELTDSEVR
jgi:peptidyl-dipeptidase A